MALTQYRLSTAVKLALPLLVVMAIAAAPSISGAAQLEQDDLHELADAAPLAKAGRGRFLANFDEALPGRSRRHLSTFSINFCSGFGYANCDQYPLAKYWTKPYCCGDFFGNSFCVDIGTPLKCGSCTTRCAGGEICCNGVCKNPISDPQNCGSCGNTCPGGKPCRFFMCGY